MTSTTESFSATGAPASRSRSKLLAELPWWAFLIILAGVGLVYNFITDETYNKIIGTLGEGVRLTAIATLSAYSMALVLGLTTALMQLSRNVIIRNVAQLYVQVIRGVPILVQIFYWAICNFPGIYRSRY
ncbi:MAG: ABC transporter permease subunit [Anaerolineae bacterium]|nr:ABC transporter permease subunit [Anaerolineae bacterium]